MAKHVTRWRGRGAHFRDFALGLHRKNVATMASRWQHCARFHQLRKSNLQPPAPEAMSMTTTLTLRLLLVATY